MIKFTNCVSCGLVAAYTAAIATGNIDQDFVRKEWIEGVYGAISAYFGLFSLVNIRAK